MLEILVFWWTKADFTLDWIKEEHLQNIISLKNVKNSDISETNLSHEMHVVCRVLVHHYAFHLFFNHPTHPTSIKRFVSWAAGNRLLKPLRGKMLDWLNFRLGEIIGLMHALEKRYYQT